MANALRGEVPLIAGETTYTLCMSINAMCELEDATGETINQLAATMNDPAKMRVGTLRLFLWAALRDRHPDTTVTDAGRIAHEAGMDVAMQAIVRSFSVAFPKAKDANARPPKRRRSGTG